MILVYKIAILAAGGMPVVAPERDYTANVDEILARVTGRTKLVFIANPNNPTGITLEEYLSGSDLQSRDIGRPKDMTSKIQKFKAQLWLSEDYPLSLQEQGMGIKEQKKK